MLKVTLGRTGIAVNKNGFGALPIQRISLPEAVKLLQKAYNGGIQYFDTARAYSDSEEKIGAALSKVRSQIFIATKSAAKNAIDLRKDLETSLIKLKTDYIDVYQFHNPSFMPQPGGVDGLYEEALKARQEGKIRFIGITNHRIKIANQIVASGLYATLQYPFSYLASQEEFALVEHCRKASIGYIAMKSLAGGLINNGRTAYAFMSEQEGVLPIWGIQREKELEQFLECQDNPPVMDANMEATIAKDQKELTGGFCRGCGYCMPCSVGINIPTAARMSLLLRRSPVANCLTLDVKENMALIPKCIHCNHCKDNCPYGLDTPMLLAANYKDYLSFL